MTNSVEIKNLDLNFGAVKVLKQLNLDIREGEFLVLLGSSGCGKSTLLNCIAGLLEVTDGQIFIKGQNVTWAEPSERGIGMVFQSYALYPQMSVRGNLSFGLKNAKVPKDEINKRVDRVAEVLQIEALLDRKPGALSGGQRQRVAIARALAPNPDVILLDEPFAALDAQLRSKLREDVRAILRAASATAILVTHDQEEALSIADQVAILRDGTVAQIGSPRSIYSQPVDVSLAKFLGDAVVIPGVVTAGKISTLLGDLIPSVAQPEGTKGQVAIRPENLYLQPDPKGLAVVTGRQFFGHDALVEVKTAAGTVKARTSGPISPEVGMPVTVWVRGSVNFYPAD